jgi:hypothetical protein
MSKSRSSISSQSFTEFGKSEWRNTYWVVTLAYEFTCWMRARLGGFLPELFLYP